MQTERKKIKVDFELILNSLLRYRSNFSPQKSPTLSFAFPAATASSRSLVHRLFCYVLLLRLLRFSAVEGVAFVSFRSGRSKSRSRVLRRL